MKIPVSEVEAITLALALHKAVNTVVQEVGTGFDIRHLCEAPPQPGSKCLKKKVDVVALAAASARVDAIAELWGVDVSNLVALTRHPEEAVHRHELLARVSRHMSRLPSVFYPDCGGETETETETDNDDET